MRRQLERIPIDRWKPHAEAIGRAVEVMKQGDAVAFPTDTVYGLAAPATEDGARQLAAIKSRLEANRFLVALLDVPREGRWIQPMGVVTRRWISVLWPQPISLLLPAGPDVPPGLCSSSGLVGLRRAADPTTRALAAAMDGAVISTSANLSGGAPGLDPEQISVELGGRIGLLLDGGRLPPDSQPTTIIDLLSSPPRVVRQGAYSRERISELLGCEIAA